LRCAQQEQCADGRESQLLKCFHSKSI
jgi:hypothetical protein